jgi:DNA polymerase-3 subunit beta
MKITVLQENLSKGLSVVSRSVSSKATLPILSNILISTDNGSLKLSATNLETGINFWIGAKIDEEGAITIPAKFLTEFIASLPNEKIEIEVKENIFYAQCGSYKANIAGMAASEFPQIPAPSEESMLVFNKDDFIQAVNQVFFAAASDEGRPTLTGVLIKAEEGQVSFVATDGYRLFPLKPFLRFRELFKKKERRLKKLN